MDEYLKESNDMCVVKAMTYEEKSQRRVVEIAGSRRLYPFCLRAYCCDETQSSNLASSDAAIEDDDAKDANIQT